MSVAAAVVVARSEIGRGTRIGCNDYSLCYQLHTDNSKNTCRIRTMRVATLRDHVSPTDAGHVHAMIDPDENGITT